MKTAILGAVLLVAGAVLVATGVLPLADAAAVGQRVWPILLFVVAITVVTELAAEAELFRVVAERAAGWGRGRTWLLWLFVVLFAVLATVFLSLDTTAVLLTPVVILLARHVGLPAGVGALAANLVDNLPAYLALEPSAGRDPVRLAALLIGVNAGPLVTPWASLATLLWHQRLVAMDVTLSWWRYIALGAVVAPLTVAGAVAALWLAAR